MEIEKVVSGMTEGFEHAADTSQIMAEGDTHAEVVLDLKEYMNNKAFLTREQLDEGKLQVDFSSIGHCYIMENAGTLEVLCGPDHKIILPEVGKEYEIEFQFTDYIYEPCFGETIVWKGQGIHKQEDGYEWMPETLYLYSQRLQMPDAVIDRIILPINPSIHIFAVNAVQNK